MKSTVITVLVAFACSPVLASEPIVSFPTTPAVSSPVVIETPPASAATEAKSVVPPRVVQPAASTPSFCGQAEVYRLFMNTETGKQLQLQHQEALRPASAQAAADGRIPAQQPELPAATQPAQPAPAESTTPRTTAPQN